MPDTSAAPPAPHSIGIIQARMGSTRLPGKVLLPVMGRPLLSYMLERLGRCRRLDAVVVATTTQPADDAVAEVAAACGVPVFRGSEEDVLDRYYQAARGHGADIVVRLTADCPLIEPAVCDTVVGMLADAGPFGYVKTGPRFAEGLDCEALTMAALEVSWRDARLRSEREHVTLYIDNHPELFTVRILDNDRDDSLIRITVDEPVDFQVVSTLLAELYPTNPAFGIDAIREFLAASPGVAALNNHVVRNEGLLISLRQDGPVAPESS